MNICITGALGHIGSKLIRNIALPSVKAIHLVDNLSTQRYVSLLDLPKKPHFVFHELDINDKRIESVIKQSDILIHLAAITDAETSAKKVDVVNKVNRDGLKHVALLCARHNVPLIFPSTTSVYGSAQQVVDEACSRDELKPQSPYAHSKLYGESLLRRMYKKGELKTVILRVGTIYGYSVGMRFHTAVNKFIYQACLGQPVTVWKTALHQKRPYCSLDDLTGAIHHIIKKKIYDGEIYNIISNNFTVSDILKHIKKYVPQIQIKLVDSLIMNQLSYEVSNTKSLKAGFTYKGNVDRSIRETISHLKHINYSVKKTV